MVGWLQKEVSIRKLVITSGDKAKGTETQACGRDRPAFEGCQNTVYNKGRGILSQCETGWKLYLRQHSQGIRRQDTEKARS